MYRKSNIQKYLRKYWSVQVKLPPPVSPCLLIVAIVLGVALFAAGGPAAADARSSSLDLSRYRGKVVYLDFWASWCAPCKLSFPYMERLAYAYSGQRLVIIVVNVDHSRERANAFLSQVGGTLPVVYDSKGDIARRYGVQEMPTSILIDRDGRVRYVNKGFFAGQIPLYEARISELLNEK